MNVVILSISCYVFILGLANERDLEWTDITEQEDFLTTGKEKGPTEAAPHRWRAIQDLKLEL